MKLNFRCLPTGRLPYNDAASALRMMQKIYPSVPYLALLPKFSKDETLLSRTLFGLIGFRTAKGNEIHFLNNQWITTIDSAYNKCDSTNLDSYIFKNPFFFKYCDFIKAHKPPFTVINLLGAFSISQMIKAEDIPQVITDKIIRKVLIQSISVKAIAYIKKIQELSPKTKTIIIFEEPALNTFGAIKREDEDVTRDVIITLFSKIFQKIKQSGGIVGVQCFEKCDWSLVTDAGADIISFDAYNNPNNVGIIPEKINDFLAKGGYINWAIVPVKNEELIKSLKTDMLYDRFVQTVNAIAEQGISYDNLYKRATISVQGNMDTIPIIFSEKAMLLAHHMGHKLANSLQQPQNPQ